MNEQRTTGDELRGGDETQPPLWHEALWGLEWVRLRWSPVYAARGVYGDGSAVVLVPGMFADDTSLVELHGWLRRAGYRPYFSGIGVNADCPERTLPLLLKMVERAARETGQPVRIVGHSLGGLLARGAAQRRPDLVTQVVTLGTPVHGVRAHPAVLAAANLVGRTCRRDCIARLQTALPATVAQTCIYSREDAVVAWQTSVSSEATNIEVRGTHVGLVVNAEVYAALAVSLDADTRRLAERAPRRATVAALRSRYAVIVRAKSPAAAEAFVAEPERVCAAAT